VSRPASLPVLLVLGLAGCVFHGRAPLPGPRAGEWAEVRTAATRRVALYDGLVHRATATATHLGLPEREARARRLATWLGWTEEELEKRLAQEREEAARGETFLIAFYAADKAANDLDARHSVWRMALLKDGGEVLVRHVQVLDPDATITQLFPYVGKFDTVYQIDFPPVPGGPISGQPFILRFASALGRIDLDFGRPSGPDRPVEEVPEL